MNRKILAGVGLVAAAVAVIAVVSGALKHTEAEEPMDTSAVVETQMVSIGSLSADSSYIGTISAEGTSGVMTQVSGVVKGVSVSVGDVVAEGALLCDMDDEGARLSLETAEKNYQTTLAGYGGEDLSLVKEKLRLAQNNYESMAVLYQAGGISRVDWEQAGQTLRGVQAELAAAEAGVQAAALQVETARYQYSLHHLTAPVGGVVEAVNVTVNNYFPSGQVAFVISNAENKTATFFVTDSVRGSLSMGQPVTVSYQSQKYDGVISEISGVVDASAGLFQIKAIINNAHSLADGLSVELTMTTHRVEDRILIPCDALYFEGGVAYVYVVEDGIALRREVELDLYTTEQAAVNTGLAVGEEIITTWSSALKDGAAVRAAQALNLESVSEAGETAAETAAGTAAETAAGTAAGTAAETAAGTAAETAAGTAAGTAAETADGAAVGTAAGNSDLAANGTQTTDGRRN